MTRALLLALTLASCGPAYAHDIPQVETVYWSDADSGWINGKKNGYAFRLANVDAPETRSMKQRGGAKCEAERKLGYEAKAHMLSLRGPYVITAYYGHDRYERHVVDLSALQGDAGELGRKAGMLKAWRHKKGKALAVKPDWCAFPLQ